MGVTDFPVGSKVPAGQLRVRAAPVTGRYLKRFAVLEANPEASDVAIQEGLLARGAELTGLELPR